MDNVMTIKKGDKEVKCKIIFTYYSEEFKKNYVVFQPEDEDVISAMSYVESDDKTGTLSAIETEEEWEMLEEIVNEYYSDKGDNGCDGVCEGCNGCPDTGEAEI